jgi:hypothetical protein
VKELLNNPAVQAGFAPFLAALITAELFQRLRLSGLAVIVGFAVTVYLASDFTIEPLTASRKIVLLGLTSALLGLVLTSWHPRLISLSLAILGGSAAVWTVFAILHQQPIQTALLWGAGCFGYVATLIWSMDRLASNPLRAAGAATGLGMGTGGSALVGASALLGQFGLSLGSSAAACILIHVVSNRPLPTGRAFTLPVALILGLTGCLAVLGANLPWYALPILAAIPLISAVMPFTKPAPRMQSFLYTIPALGVAACAVYVTWRVAGDVPF